MLSKWGILPKIALPWLWPLCVLCGKTLLCGRSDVQHWQKISFHFFSYDTQHIWQDTHQVWRGKQLKCPLANEKFCQIMCHPDTLEIFCSYFMFRVNIPGVDHYWNKDPSKVVFLFQLWPCFVVLPHLKHIQILKNRGDHFVKWNDTPTILLYDECSVLRNAHPVIMYPPKQHCPHVLTCFNFCRVDISSWCPLEL
jgi:hypothetical protein